MPVMVTAATVRRSSARNDERISDPALNISSMSPSWYIASSTIGTGPVAGNTWSCSPGAIAPSTVGPSSSPPTISPITRGWPNRFAR